MTTPDPHPLGYATSIPQRGDTTQASCRLDSAVSRLVDALAEQRGWTRSQALRHLIVAGLGVATAKEPAAPPTGVRCPAGQYLPSDTGGCCACGQPRAAHAVGQR